ncbi:hypothetical protein F7725_006006 [Dissostichus mawsoni]|uniref:Uncharacterized protein n=1 Tax=Dissostichus mawsoni TaxID=36200 RepID=A0A7J5YUZ6_DISMA|nr:hypothetical protein F7725_006006 [Dissostichus mawsoni]
MRSEQDKDCFPLHRWHAGGIRSQSHPKDYWFYQIKKDKHTKASTAMPTVFLLAPVITAMCSTEVRGHRDVSTLRSQVLISQERSAQPCGREMSDLSQRIVGKKEKQSRTVTALPQTTTSCQTAGSSRVLLLLSRSTSPFNGYQPPEKTP